MRAARYHGTEDIRIDEIEEPKPGKGQVKIAPAYVGICGTDLHEYHSATFCPVDKPHPVTGEKVPIVMGHEFSGVVTELGEGAKGFKVGDNVVVQPTIACWGCGPCKVGAENTCDKGGFTGLSGGGGGLADALCVEDYKVFKLPDNVSLEIGALVEPLVVGWHAVSASPMKSGDKAIVFGGGPIGLAVVQALKARGASFVISVEVAPARQKFAKQFGADAVLDPSKEDIVARSRELCGGEVGPDVAFDCAGVPATLKAACHAVRSRGTVVNVAIWEKEVPFNPNWCVFKESNFTAVLGYQKADFEHVLKAMGEDKFKPEGMITKKIKLEDLVEEGIKTLINDKENQVKILVDIHAK